MSFRRRAARLQHRHGRRRRCRGHRSTKDGVKRRAASNPFDEHKDSTVDIGDNPKLAGAPACEIEDMPEFELARELYDAMEKFDPSYYDEKIEWENLNKREKIYYFHCIRAVFSNRKFAKLCIR